MQNTSALWKSLWASGAARLETRAIIAGVEYTDISAPVINRALMQGGLSIGNAVSATCSFSVRNPGTIPKSAEVVIQKRLTDGTQTSEWITCGTFYISHRQRDPVTGVLELECYDALLKANADMPALMPWTTKGGEPMRTKSGEMLYFSAHYPRKMSAVMEDIALILGGAIRIDPATEIETGAAYTIDEVPRGTRIVDILRKIAAANGGNWIMTPENTLKLVPVISAAGAASATENVVDVDGVVGGIGVSNTGTITGIRYTEDGEQKVAGNETGIVLDADVSATVAAALLTKLSGMTYQAYTLSGAVYDPAAELGDYIRAGAGGEVASVIYAETATLGPAYRGSVSAPEIGELADEYPYVGSNAQLLTLAQQYADEAVQTFDNSLTQQEVFDRLTDGGLTQGISLEPVNNPGPSAATPKRVFLNVDYVNDGTMPLKHLKGDKLTLGGENNVNGYMEILDEDGNPVLVGNNNGAAIYGGMFQNQSADGRFRMELDVGSLNFYKKINDVFTQMFSLLATDDQIEGVHLNTYGQPLIVDIDNPTNGDGLYLTCYTGNPQSGYSSVVRVLPDQISLNLRNNGSIIGSISIYIVSGRPVVYVDGDLNVSGSLAALNAPSGTFTSSNGKTITVTNGIITAIT